jgi:hypothetical protein
MNAFDTQVELEQMIEFSFNKFQNELQNENIQKKKKEESKTSAFSESESDSLSNDSDFADDQCSFEKKLHILHIPHILLWKAINEKQVKLKERTLQGQEAIDFLLGLSKKFILLVTNYMASHMNSKSFPSISNFMTFLITYINRIIIVNRDFFMY